MRAGAWPTVGRSSELASLDNLVTAAHSGTGGLVLVEAEAGGGKTHLLDELCSRVDLTVARARVPAPELAVPFAAPLAAMQTTLAALDVVPATGPRSMIEAGAGEIGQAVVIDGLLRLIEDRSTRAPLLLVLDDVHAADTGTLAWLDQLRQRLASLHLAIVLAARPPAPASPYERFRPTLTNELVLRLAPLAPSDVASLAERVLGGRPDPALADALARADGLPLVVTAILESARAGLDHVAAAPDAVVERIRAVPHDVGTVLLAAAVLGDEFVVGHVPAMLGLPLADVMTALDTAERSGLVVPEGTRLRFRHEFYRQAVLTSASPPTVAALHSAAADACAATAEPPIVIARHVIASGMTRADAVPWLIDAAESVVAFAPDDALTMADAALRTVDDPPRRLRTIHGRALASVGRVAEAEAILRQMLATAPTPADELRLRRELALALFQQGRPAESMVEMARAVDLADDEVDRARLRAEEAFTHVLAGQFVTAGQIAEDELRAAAAIGDLTTEVAASMVSCLVRLYHGELAAALDLADRLEQLTALAATSDAAVYQPWFAAGMARVEADDHVGARRIAAVGQSRCIDAGYYWMVPGYDALAAYCSLRAGELGDAIAEATAALDWRITDRLGVAVWCHAFIARAAAHRGELERAESELAAADRLIDQGRAQLGWDHVGLARAAVAERRGHPEAAYQALADVWDLHLALGVKTAVQETGPELVRLGVVLGRPERTAEVLAVLDDAAERIGDATRLGDRARAWAWHDHDPDGLAQAATHFGRSPRRLLRATALAELAAWRHEAGDRTAAATAARQARDEFETCGATGDSIRVGDLLGRTARHRRRPTSGPESLSRSETAVVQLVAEGLANTEIAARLHISRRTVESHVSAAYRKLGVSNRVELARAGMAVDTPAGNR